MISWKPNLLKTKIYLYQPIQLEYLTLIRKNIHLVLSCLTIKIWGELIKLFVSYDRTYKQTNRYYCFIYM